MRSLRNRLAFVFFAITLLAIAALYVYVAPGLGSRLEGEKLNSLAQVARSESRPIARTVGSSQPQRVVRARVMTAAVRSGDHVTLLAVNRVGGRPQLSLVASSTPTPPSFLLAYRAIQTGKLETRTAGTVAEAGEHAQPELGWTLSREHWGHGYATEGAYAVREWARDELGMGHLISLIHPDNVKDPLCDVDSHYAIMLFHRTRLLWWNGFTGPEIILAH